jgi:hypothetical protein
VENKPKEIFANMSETLESIDDLFEEIELYIPICLLTLTGFLRMTF